MNQKSCSQGNVYQHDLKRNSVNPRPIRYPAECNVVHLRNAQQSYVEADGKLDRARNALDEMAQGAPETKALEPAALD